MLIKKETRSCLNNCCFAWFLDINIRDWAFVSWFMMCILVDMHTQTKFKLHIKLIFRVRTELYSERRGLLIHSLLYMDNNHTVTHYSLVSSGCNSNIFVIIVEVLYNDQTLESRSSQSRSWLSLLFSLKDWLGFPNSAVPLVSGGSGEWWMLGRYYWFPRALCFVSELPLFKTK